MRKLKVTRGEKLTVFGQQVVGPSDDKFLNLRRQFLQLSFSQRHLRFTRIRIASSENRQFIRLAKLGSVTQVIRIGEVEKGEIFGQVVLDRRARQDDSPFTVDPIQSCISLIV
jgi:hypothetical protein